MADLGKTLVAGDLIVIDDTILGGSLSLSGNLGVGVKAPTEAIDLVGNIRLTGTIKTGSGGLKVQDFGDAYTLIKASSLILGSSADSYTAPPNGAYIQGNVGLGISPAYKLDVSGDIRTNGQLRITAAAPKPPLILSSNVLVPNLNADKVDGYEAADIFNSSILSTGYGIIEGCTTAAVTSSLAITVNSGSFLVKDVGYMSISTANYSGFTANCKHIVFLAGRTATEGGKNLVAGQVAIATGTSTTYPNMSGFTNPIILCRVDIPLGISALSNSYIYANRTILPLISDTTNNSISLFTSDNSSANIQSGGHILTSRVLIKPNGDSTQFILSTVPGNLKLELSPDMISLKSGVQEQTVTATKIANWDDAGSKLHSHIYDSPLYLVADNGSNTIITITEPLPILKKNIKVYINGLRQKRDVDYEHNISNPKIMTFTKLINSAIDNVVIDYDI